MKTKDIKGMRDIPTIQGIRNRSTPSTREQAVTELARLEHEKARLERELNMWIENQEKTEERLRRVEERLAILQRVLDESSTDEEHRDSGGQRKADDGREARDWREIPLEY